MDQKSKRSPQDYPRELSLTKKYLQVYLQQNKIFNNLLLAKSFDQKGRNKVGIKCFPLFFENFKFCRLLFQTGKFRTRVGTLAFTWFSLIVI